MKLEKFHEAKNKKRAMTAKWITAVAVVAALGFAIARLAAVGRLIDWLIAVACGTLLSLAIEHLGDLID